MMTLLGFVEASHRIIVGSPADHVVLDRIVSVLVTTVDGEGRDGGGGAGGALRPETAIDGIYIVELGSLQRPERRRFVPAGWSC